MFRICPSTGLTYHEPARSSFAGTPSRRSCRCSSRILALSLTLTRWQTVHLLAPDWFYLI